MFKIEIIINRYKIYKFNKRVYKKIEKNIFITRYYNKKYICIIFVNKYKMSSSHISEVDIDYPNEYTCPIGYNLIEEAVIDSYGNTYDKINIYRWLEQRSTSPLTNQPLKKENLVPNRFLQDLIIKFKQENNLIGKKIKVKEYKTLAKKDYIFDKESFIENLVFNNKIFKLENDYYLNINIKMPKENPTGKHYIICLDISGSMGMEAIVKDASGSESSQ